jgi:hypothetical protein
MVRGEWGVTAFVASARRTVNSAALTVAEVAGKATRRAPGILAAGAVCFGLGLAWLPLGFIAAGIYLHAIDWKMP